MRAERIPISVVSSFTLYEKIHQYNFHSLTLPGNIHYVTIFILSLFVIFSKIKLKFYRYAWNIPLNKFHVSSFDTQYHRYQIFQILQYVR